jgi:hypothetical protein
VVECARINDVSGDIMVCRGKIVTIYTLNGELVLEQNVCEGSGDREDYVSACAWYEGCGNEWLENSLLFTGQRGGIVNIWKKAIISSSPSRSSPSSTTKQRNSRSTFSPWKLELVKRLDHAENIQGGSAVGSLGVPGSVAGARQRSRSRGRSVSGNRGGVRDEAAITCIAPGAQVVYTGDEEGRVVSSFLFPLYHLLVR